MENKFCEDGLMATQSTPAHQPLQSNWPVKDSIVRPLPGYFIYIDDRAGITIAEYDTVIQARAYLKRTGYKLGHTMREYYPTEEELQANGAEIRSELRWERGFGA